MTEFRLYLDIAWKALLVAIVIPVISVLYGLLRIKQARSGILRLFYSTNWQPRRYLLLYVVLYLLACYALIWLLELTRGGGR